MRWLVPGALEPFDVFVRFLYLHKFKENNQTKHNEKVKYQIIQGTIKEGAKRRRIKTRSNGVVRTRARALHLEGH